MRNPDWRGARMRCFALLFLAAIGCAHPRDPAAAWSPLTRFCWDSHVGLEAEGSPKRIAALTAILRYLDARLTVRVLSAEEVARIGGAKVVDAAGYRSRLLVTAATLSVARDDESNSLSLRGMWLGADGWVPERAGALDEQARDGELFGLAQAAKRPSSSLPWPSNPIDQCRRGEKSNDLADFAILVGKTLLHVSTAGLLLLGDALAGGGGPAAQPDLVRLLREVDAYEMDPARLAARRFHAARGACRARAGYPCDLYTLLAPGPGGPEQDRLLLTLRFDEGPSSTGVHLAETLVLPLPPGGSLAQRLERLTATPLSLADVAQAAAAEAGRALPRPVELPVLPASPPPGPLPLAARAEVHALGRVAAQAVLRVPLLPAPDLLLYECRLRDGGGGGAGPAGAQGAVGAWGRRCALRVEAAEEIWEDAIPDRASPASVYEFLARDLLYAEHHYVKEDLVALPEALGGRLMSLREEQALSLLRRVPQHRWRGEERVIVYERLPDGGRREASFPLPPGATLADRINGAFLGAAPGGGVLGSGAAGMRATGVVAPVPVPAPRRAWPTACAAGEAEDCLRAALAPATAATARRALLDRACALGSGHGCAHLGRLLADSGDQDGAAAALRAGCRFASGEACLGVAERGVAGLLDRACALGAGAACRAQGYAALGCELGDPISCETEARREQGDLRLYSQRGRALAYTRLCRLGQSWACNDLAVLLGRIAKVDSDASQARCSEVMMGLLTDSCARGEAVSCRNKQKMSARDTALDALEPARP